MGFTFSLKMVPRSWYQDLGTKILVPRSWYQDLGTRILVPGSWYQDLGTKILVPRSWYQDLGTSNSRPWRSIGSFMYIGSAGPGPGGRADGQRADGRAGGWAGGRDDFERQYNDFHRFSQKTSKNTVFFCRFASGGSASTDFYSSNEKGVQKMSKIDSVF